MLGTIIEAIKGDARSLDFSSCVSVAVCRRVRADKDPWDFGKLETPRLL